MKQKDEDGWRGFIQLLCHLSSQEQEMLVELFFTIEERNDLSKRYWIVKDLLQSRKTQREIAKDLKVSISKITRGSNALKQINKHLKEQLKKLL